jgi:hypothetical protein
VSEVEPLCLPAVSGAEGLVSAKSETKAGVQSRSRGAKPPVLPVLSLSKGAMSKGGASIMQGARRADIPCDI